VSSVNASTRRPRSRSRSARQPFVVAPLEQVAAIQRGRRSQRAPAGVGVGRRRIEQPLELGHVEPHRRLGTPPHRPGGDLEVVVGAGKVAAQCVQQVAQVGPSLRFAGVGPQQERQALPRLRHTEVEQQDREQRLGATRAQGADGRAVMLHDEAPEQTGARDRRRHADSVARTNTSGTTPARAEPRAGSAHRYALAGRGAQAAALSGESASDFARRAAIARAEEILQRQERTEVPSDFFDALLRALDEPPVRNERLAEAAKRARDIVIYSDQ
jgi:uncharacterized protein (DUF1778 family)